jgi:hypothetical protein
MEQPAMLEWFKAHAEWIGAIVTVITLAYVVVKAIEALMDWWNDPKH